MLRAQAPLHSDTDRNFENSLLPSTLPGPGKNLAKQSSVILPKSQQAREVPQVVGNILKEMDYSWVGLDPLAYFYSNL